MLLKAILKTKNIKAVILPVSEPYGRNGVNFQGTEKGKIIKLDWDKGNYPWRIWNSIQHIKSWKKVAGSNETKKLETIIKGLQDQLRQTIAYELNSTMWTESDEMELNLTITEEQMIMNQLGQKHVG